MWIGMFLAEIFEPDPGEWDKRMTHAIRQRSSQREKSIGQGPGTLKRKPAKRNGPDTPSVVEFVHVKRRDFSSGTAANR
jgi:hypothetical protein